MNSLPPTPGSRRTRRSRPNLLVVVFDTARADATEPYGAPRGTTPTLAQLAAAGVALDGRSTACWTLPSHISLFSGLLPRAAGRPPGRGPRHARPVVARMQPRWLPGVLRQGGWRTIGVSVNLWVSPRSGFDLGFDSFDWVRSGRGGRFPTTRRQRLRWTVEAVAARRDDGAKEAAGRLLRRIDGDDDDRPFFAFVNLLECHSPYLPPKPWNDLSPRRRLRAGETARRYQTYEAFARVCLTDAEIPERELADMRYLYSRAVSSMDSWLAGVLEALEHRGLLDDTVVVVLSDHGENFGEGGLVNHMFSLDDRLLRVPLVLFGPGVERWSGHAQPVSLADLPAMLAEVVGLQHHPWTAGEAGRDGVTVAQFDPPATADDPAARDIERRWSLDEASFARLTSPLTSATDGRLKLLRRPAGELLVDLEGDPLELDPRPAPIADDRLTHLRSALDRAAAVEAPEIRETVDEPGLSDAERVELEEQMRLLGYL